MKKLIILIVLLWVTNSHSQCYNLEDYKTSFSAFTSFNFSKGFEVRGEFNDWYLALRAENFRYKEQHALNWGASLGIMKEYTDFDVFGGIQVGMMNLEDEGQKPAFGIELETDYKISQDVFIGIRGAYDIYFNSPHVITPNSESLLRGFVKLGYKF